MAIAKVADRGAVGDTAASTTTLVDLAAGASITTGNYLIARVSCDNSGTNGAAPGLTVTDTPGNTWTVQLAALQDPGAANAGVAAYLAWTKVTAAYANGDDITFTYGVSTTADCIVVEEWSGIHATTPVAVSVVPGNGSGTAMSAGPITPTAAGQLVYAIGAVESRAPGYTGDSDTTDGSWVALTTQTCDTGTNTGSVSVVGQYKLVTATSAQTWDATITSNDWAAGVMVFAEAASSGTNAAAEAATSTGTANNATTKVAPGSQAATSTGTAETPSVKVSPSVGAATATGAAGDATTKVAPTSESATSTGTANDATTKVSPQVGAASATGTANNPAAGVAPSTTVASGTGTAGDVTGKVSPQVGTATATGTAYDATVSTSAVVADAEALTISFYDTGHTGTIRDRGHTGTVNDRGHTATFRE